MSSHSTLQGARNQFLGSLLSSVAVLLVLIVIPKDEAPGSLIRLAMTAAFFLFAISAIWSFTDPLDHYIKARLAARYGGMGTAIDLTLGLIRVNVMAVVQPVAWIAMAVIGFIGLDVLSAWPAFAVFRPLAPLLQWGWFVSLLLLVIVPVMRGRQLFQLLNLLHQFREQIATTDSVPKTPEDLERARARESEPPVVVLGEQSFRAGGFDWDWSDFYKNLIVFGQPGSGKTVCVLNALFDGLLSSTASSMPAAGLILDPKGDFKDKISLVMRRLGRERDLLIFDPDNPQSFRWNPFDTPDDALEVANRFGAIFEMQGGQGDESAFFIQQSKAFLHATLTLVRLTNGPAETPSIAQFIPLMGDKKAVVKAMAIANDRFDRFSDMEKRLADAAIAYLADVWLPMSDKTRSGVVSTLSNILTPFTYPPFDRIMSGRSTMQLSDCIDAGKVLYVNFPIARRRLMAQVVGTLLKVEYGRQVLLRQGKPRPSFLFCDEFQVFFTTDKETNDSDFFERSRGSNHANIIATQNRPALLKRSDDQHVVDNLLGNCATKIFLRNTDIPTNQWASDLFGDRLETVVNTTRSVGSLNPRQSGASTGVAGASSYAPSVRPEAFTRLAQPAAAHGIDYADAIVHSAARAVVSREDLRWRVHPL